MSFEFEEFPKIARLKREVVITEKLDGTNAQVAWLEIKSHEECEQAARDPYCLGISPGDNLGDSPLALYVGSRTRWIAPEGSVPGADDVAIKGTDNFGFAAWVMENREELRKLGPGRHYGEWYGHGIQIGYGYTDPSQRWFALFNTARWGSHNPNTPLCCEVVTRLDLIGVGGERPRTSDECMALLAEHGSQHVPGWKKPEGIVVYHSASRTLYKQTFRDDGGKWQSNRG